MEFEVLELEARATKLESELRAVRAKIDLAVSKKAEADTAKVVDELPKQNSFERISAFKYMRGLPLRIHLSGPFVYGMIIPILFLDISLAIYQGVCFRIWRISLVKRADHIIVDRHKLNYLNGLEKLNCAYCGYATGVFAFAREIAARTEHYWCPIKHRQTIRDSHGHYQQFTEFGDLDAWQDHPSRKMPGRACENCELGK